MDYQRNELKKPSKIAPVSAMGKKFTEVEGIENYYKEFEEVLVKVSLDYPQNHSNYDILSKTEWFDKLDYKEVALQTVDALKYTTAWIEAVSRNNFELLRKMQESGEIDNGIMLPKAWLISITTYINIVDESFGNPYFFRGSFYKYLKQFIRNVRGLDLSQSQREELITYIEERIEIIGSTNSNIINWPELLKQYYVRWKNALPDLPCFESLKNRPDKFPIEAIRHIQEIDIKNNRVWVVLKSPDEFLVFLKQLSQMLVRAESSYYSNLQTDDAIKLQQEKIKSGDLKDFGFEYTHNLEKDTLGIFNIWLNRQMEAYKELVELRKAKSKKQKKKIRELKELFFNEQNKEVVTTILSKYQNRKYSTAICVGMADALIKAKWTKLVFTADEIAQVISVNYFEKQLPARLDRARKTKYEKYRNEFYLKLTGSQWRK